MSNYVRGIELVVLHDYNGFFEQMVKGWIEHKTSKFKHERIEIYAMPFLPNAVEMKSDGTTLHMKLYSAMHAGFGQLSEKEIQEIIDEWL